MNRDIEQLQEISTTARTNPNLITPADINFVTKSLQSSNEKVVAQAYATVGHIGMNRSELVRHLIDRAFSALKEKSSDIREQALLAIGNIGRHDISIVSDQIEKILQMHCDCHPKVRSAMLIACQNIACAKASVLQPYVGLFERMLDDPDEALVQKHVLQVFRTIGKYEPQIVERSLVVLKDKLRKPSPVTKDQTIEVIRTIETFLRRPLSV